MMSYVAYKVWHFVGLAMVLVSLGAWILHRGDALSRRFLAMVHGVGLLVVLVTGFGMVARLGSHWPLPTWIWAKLGLWLALGAYLAVAKRVRHRFPAFLVWGLVALAGVGAWLAGTKPF